MTFFFSSTQSCRLHARGLLPSAWFGAVTSLFTGLLAWEASGSANAGVAAAAVMAVLPAHLMRSVAGGYDNESVAMTALCCTFWLWPGPCPAHPLRSGLSASVPHLCQPQCTNDTTI